MTHLFAFVGCQGDKVTPSNRSRHCLSAAFQCTPFRMMKQAHMLVIVIIIIIIVAFILSTIPLSFPQWKWRVWRGML